MVARIDYNQHWFVYQMERKRKNEYSIAVIRKERFRKSSRNDVNTKNHNFPANKIKHAVRIIHDAISLALVLSTREKSDYI